METFTKLKEFVKNPHFQEQRQRSLIGLVDAKIDLAIIELIKSLNELPYCFTLQSCYGHFQYDGQDDMNNIAPLPKTNTISKVQYRIAYIAFCIENSQIGKQLFEALKEITAINLENVQFCCAQWFWKRHVNSYVLQVEPGRFKYKDTSILEYKEALYIEKIRNEFFIRIAELPGKVK